MSIIDIDDILIRGESKEKHLELLDEAHTRLENVGIRQKLHKCYFMKHYVEYLGQNISTTAIQPTEEKIWALRDEPTPQNVSQLRSLLGLVNYLTQFVKYIGTIVLLVTKGNILEMGDNSEKMF